MANSIRDLIMVSLAGQLANITAVNGYDIDVLTVARARRIFMEPDLPAIGFYDTDEESVTEYGDQVTTVLVTIDMHADAGAVNASTYGNSMLAVLKKGVFSQDTTHAGEAVRTEYVGGSIRYPDDDDNGILSASLDIRITYNEVAGDPYLKP